MLLNTSTYMIIREDSDRLLWNWLSSNSSYPTVDMDDWIKYASLFSYNLTFGGNKIVSNDNTSNISFLSDTNINGVYCYSFRFLLDITHNNGIGLTDGVRAYNRGSFIGMSFDNFEYSIMTEDYKLPMRARYLPIRMGDIVTLIANVRSGILTYMVNFNENRLLKYVIPTTNTKLFVGTILHNNSIEILDGKDLSLDNINNIISIINNSDETIPYPPITHSLSEALMTSNLNDVIYYRHAYIRDPIKLFDDGLKNGSIECIRYLVDCNIFHKSYIGYNTVLTYLTDANREALEFILSIQGRQELNDINSLSEFFELFPPDEEDTLRWILTELLDISKLSIIPGDRRVICYYRYFSNIIRYHNTLIKCGVDCSNLNSYCNIYGIGASSLLNYRTTVKYNHENFKSLIYNRRYDSCQWMIDNISGFKDEFCYQLLVDRKPIWDIAENVLDLIEDTLHGTEYYLRSAQRLANNNQTIYFEWIINNDILPRYISKLSLDNCLIVVRRARHHSRYGNTIYSTKSKDVRDMYFDYQDYIVRTLYPLICDHIDNYIYTTYDDYIEIEQQLENINNYLPMRFNTVVSYNMHNAPIASINMLINYIINTTDIYMLELQKYLDSNIYCTLDAIRLLNNLEEDNSYYEDIVLAIVRADMKHLNEKDMTSLKNSYDLCVLIGNTKYRGYIIGYIYHIVSLATTL